MYRRFNIAGKELSQTQLTVNSRCKERRTGNREDKKENSNSKAMRVRANKSEIRDKSRNVTVVAIDSRIATEYCKVFPGQFDFE
jgi:hypothetical protein